MPELTPEPDSTGGENQKKKKKKEKKEMVVDLIIRRWLFKV
jgi:hypothetical protein